MVFINYPSILDRIGQNTIERGIMNGNETTNFLLVRDG